MPQDEWSVMLAREHEAMEQHEMMTLQLPASRSTCAWQRMPQEQHGWWRSECGTERYLEDASGRDGPVVNGCRHCLLCGGPLA